MANPTRTPHTHTRILATLTLTLAVVAGLLAALPARHAIASSWVLATTHQPEPLTELYFSDRTSLPKTFHPGEPQSFSFTIHNLEGKPMTYHYQVSINGQPAAAPASITIPDGAIGKITPSIAISDSSTRAEVEVSLIDLHQSIHYWTESTQ